MSQFKRNIKDKDVAVIGVGVSNIALIKFLLRCGAKITAFDKKADLGEIFYQLKKEGVKFSLGENYLSALNHEIIFKSPGIRYDIPELVQAAQNQSVITSEMEIFFDICPAEIIGVTGSDGKTTTTSLIYQMLKAEGYTCHLGGNIGRPLIDQADTIAPGDKVVLELSSFQLHTMKASPKISVVTNVTPNHLDMHKSMAEYVCAKKNIFLHQDKSCKLVLNYDNEVTRGFAAESKGEVVFFGRTENAGDVYIKDDWIYFRQEKLLDVGDIFIPGAHNAENYMAAIGAVRSLVSGNSIYNTAVTFKGVEHRIELVRDLGGIRFYNDSIASSPTRTIAGLNSFEQKVILIAGGYDKKIPFDELGRIIAQRVKTLVLMGATAGKIKAAVDLYNSNVQIIMADSLTDAVHKAYDKAVAGDVITLSPACASFDMFENFEQRGNEYKKIVGSI